MDNEAGHEAKRRRPRRARRTGLARKEKRRLHHVPFQYTEICHRARYGTCVGSAECKHAHSASELVRLDPVHLSPDERVAAAVYEPLAPGFKTVLCPAFATFGACPAGRCCNNAHGRDELLLSEGEENAATAWKPRTRSYCLEACVIFLAKRTCSSGRFCNYAHGPVVRPPLCWALAAPGSLDMGHESLSFDEVKARSSTYAPWSPLYQTRVCVAYANNRADPGNWPACPRGEFCNDSHADAPLVMLSPFVGDFITPLSPEEMHARDFSTLNPMTIDWSRTCVTYQTFGYCSSGRMCIRAH